MNVAANTIFALLNIVVKSEFGPLKRTGTMAFSRRTGRETPRGGELKLTFDAVVPYIQNLVVLLGEVYGGFVGSEIRDRQSKCKTFFVDAPGQVHVDDGRVAGQAFGIPVT